ncbi:RNA ligase/cyclic nucleotide phosphodiesterase [Terfezia claveryi]|nr:RNA ligase/cyclic nucleotide phosphodiesterase [Terfezia claveryi]
MPAVLTAIGTDATNSFEDLSGISVLVQRKQKHAGTCNGCTTGGGCTTASSSPPVSPSSNSTEMSDTDDDIDNPYDVLIQACDNNPIHIATAYSRHRTARNALSRTTIVSPDFPGPTIDPLLTRLIAHSPSLTQLVEDDALDPRHGLVFWARPNEGANRLIGEVQRRLLEAQTSGGASVPGKQFWAMPRDNLHITALEVTHSTTYSAVESLLGSIGRPLLEKMVAWPKGKGVRLGKPLLSYDKAALAISFLPLEGGKNKSYTYHHLRRDLWGILEKGGFDVDSRYIVPSAHVTVGRFFRTESTEGVEEPGAVQMEMKRWIRVIDSINDWLEKEGDNYMRGENGEADPFWEMDSPLVLRKGRLWYGGGDSVL